MESLLSGISRPGSCSSCLRSFGPRRVITFVAASMLLEGMTRYDQVTNSSIHAKQLLPFGHCCELCIVLCYLALAPWGQP